MSYAILWLAASVLFARCFHVHGYWRDPAFDCEQGSRGFRS